ncbi:hypothetical protein Bca52824_010588 [Brassica carinata]|uniref:Uncharacterized protein n=1 Tax=Brassica carinata TaxID=52824 RepID=A0A8X7WER6_BRACI|nr:hypothetical protein Bca52824_010588 [Brassica carinata]
MTLESSSTGRNNDGRSSEYHPLPLPPGSPTTSLSVVILCSPTSPSSGVQGGSWVVGGSDSSSPLGVSKWKKGRFTGSCTFGKVYQGLTANPLFPRSYLKKPNGKDVVSSTKTNGVVLRDVKFGSQEGELRFHLIHFWEARNARTKTLNGLEMLSIDEHGTVIQGFIPPGRIDTYLPHMITGSIYRLTNFYGSKRKNVYRVAEPSVTITFSWNSVLSDLEDSLAWFPEDRFRFHGYEEFEAACDLKGDLYVVRDEALSMGQGCTDFVRNLEHGKTPSVILVTTVNPNDLEGTVIQGFIPPGRIDTYLPHMITGSIYRLTNFYGSKRKNVYRVAEPSVTITFSWNSVLSDLEDSLAWFPEDRFRFHGYEEFEAACDLKGDLYDYVGHMKLVNEQTLNDGFVLDEVKIASTRKILVHVQTHDCPVMKLYLWDKAATDFCEKFRAHGKTPSVILVTTVNPKRFGVAWFECTATIDDVVHGSAVGAKLRQPKGLPRLCVRNVEKLRYLTKLSVYDNNDHAIFVFLSDAGRELTGKQASELVESYFEANESVGDDHVIPVPQALIDTIGQTHKFIVKVSNHNLTGKTQALTVTKVLPPEAPAPEGSLEEKVIVPSAEETLQMGNREDGPSIGNEKSADERVKRSCDGNESEEAKRAKCG